ncbi:MAG: iron-sulfur cluster assembly scaffold protein [Promethearchaeota archaeon]
MPDEKPEGTRGRISTAEEFDKWVEEIQEEIWEQERRDFSPEVIMEYRNPHNVGRLPNPDATTAYRGSCGDQMVFDMHVSPEGGGTIQKITFITDGCSPAVACGSKLTRTVEGMTLEEAEGYTAEELDASLGRLPESHKHCAVLAVETLRRVIEEYRTKRRE